MSALKYFDTTTSTWKYLAQGVKGDPGTTGIVSQANPPSNTSALWLDTSVPGVTGSVPTGGTVNQVLAKLSDADYVTQWVSAGSGTVTSVAVTAPLTGGPVTTSGTIGIANASTSTKGAVQLNDSVVSTSTTYAATANSVKTAYDAAVTANNLATDAQAAADGKVASVTTSDSTITIGGTATNPTVVVGTVPAAQVSGLAASATTDTTNASNITSGTLAAARVATLNQDTTGNAATATNIAAGTTTLASNVTTSSLTSFGTDPVANTQAVDNNSTKIATTAFVAGQASSATPTMDGTAASGSSLRYSRQDHVHPTDTSRAPYANRAMMPIAKVSSGDWIPMQFTDATAAARVQGREYCQPIAFPYDITLDRIAIYVFTAGSAGASIRLGIRADNNGRPGTLLQDCGSIASTTSSAFVTGTISQALTAGVTYWLSAMPQGTPVTGSLTRYPSQWLPGTCGSTTQTRQALIGYYQDVTTGSTATTVLPTSFTRAGDLTLNAGDGFSWVVRAV